MASNTYDYFLRYRLASTRSVIEDRAAIQSGLIDKRSNNEDEEAMRRIANTSLQYQVPEPLTVAEEAAFDSIMNEKEASNVTSEDTEGMVSQPHGGPRAVTRKSKAAKKQTPGIDGVAQYRRRIQEINNKWGPSKM